MGPNIDADLLAAAIDALGDCARGGAEVDLRGVAGLA